MKNTIRSILCLVIVLCLCVSVPCFAQVSDANEDLITPRYTYVALLTISLNISSEGKSTCVSRVVLDNANHSCKMEMVLQREESTGWEDVKSWSSSGDQSVTLEKNWYVLSGYDYRIQTTLRVYNANGRLIETITEESSICSY